MGVAVQNKNDLAAKVARLYGLKVDKTLEPQKGYRTQILPILAGSQKLCIAIFKPEPGALKRIRKANSIGDYLADSGFAARQTYDPRILSIGASGMTRYACVYTYLPGKVIPWEGYTSRHLKTLGAAMAQMHSLLKDYPIHSLPAVEVEMLAIIGRMQSYFSSHPVKKALDQKLGLAISDQNFTDYAALVTAAKALPGRQALHMDFVRSNILFSDKGAYIKGVIDFEKAAAGHITFDVARTLAFLLVDSKYKANPQTYKEFLISGYIRRGQGRLPKITYSKTGGELELLPGLVELFWLYDLFKFLRHNPYEFLSQNQHYLRTTDQLLRRNLIARTR